MINKIFFISCRYAERYYMNVKIVQFTFLSLAQKIVQIRAATSC